MTSYRPDWLLPWYKMLPNDIGNKRKRIQWMCYDLICGIDRSLN